MSAKTQKNWRELCRDLHNEQESGNLMDILGELKGAMEQRERQRRLKVLARAWQDSILLRRQSSQPRLTGPTLNNIAWIGDLA